MVKARASSDWPARISGNWGHALQDASLSFVWFDFDFVVETESVIASNPHELSVPFSVLSEDDPRIEWPRRDHSHFFSCRLFAISLVRFRLGQASLELGRLRKRELRSALHGALSEQDLAADFFPIQTRREIYKTNITKRLAR
jgi:hypothetical protein